MRHLRISPIILSEAEIEAAYAEVAAGSTERPETWDQLTEHEIRELIDDDRR